MLSVNAKGGIKTLKEFIEHGRTTQKPLTYSSSGVGSSGQLVAEDFAQKAGIKIEHVPYKGASQGLTDLAGGHIVFSAQTVSSTAALVRGGQLRAIAHSNASADAGLPGCPDASRSPATTSSPPPGSRISGPANLPQGHHREGQPRDRSRGLQARGRRRGCGGTA